MRFSILGLNQEKLLELKLDVIDALILNWFALFFASPGMEKRVIEKKIFGWVKISKVVEDLPVLNIGSERGIKARFDIYVKKGIMERSTIQTQLGKKSFYRTTQIYELLINTPPAGANQTSPAKANQTSPAKTNQTSLAEANQTSLAEANQTSLAETNQTSLAEANQTSLAEANQTSLASLDDISSKNSSSKNSLINNSTAAALRSILFTKHSITLSDDFYCAAAEVFNYQKLDLLTYTEWFFKKLQNKKLGDIRNYVYKMFTRSDLLDQYKIEFSSKIKEKQDHYSVCPCCGSEVNDKECECPICQCDIRETNVETILYHKKYFQLTNEDKNNFDDCRNNIILLHLPFQEHIKALRELDYKFGLIDKKEILC